MKTGPAALLPFTQPTFTRGASPAQRAEGAEGLMSQLHDLSERGLASMFDATTQAFVFRVRRGADGRIVQEGESPRYTAITLLGLARRPRERDARIMGNVTREQVCDRLTATVVRSSNLGDVALTLLAAGELGAPNLQPLVDRLQALWSASENLPVVEVAWALSALSDLRLPGTEPLRDAVAVSLLASFGATSKLFPHMLRPTGSARAHVSCFADLIYPIQALSKFSAAAGSPRALDVAASAATHLCSLQGEGGQWWWHYDYRTGRVLERYPVYAIHQDAMGPMGLLALANAGGPDFRSAIRHGLEWLIAAPELRGGSLIDPEADLIWRKVARREPGKAVRYMQATASLAHPSLRVPAVDGLFPPGTIDYEDRPYHLGWLLYAWRDEDLSAWSLPARSGGATR